MSVGEPVPAACKAPSSAWLKPCAQPEHRHRPPCKNCCKFEGSQFSFCIRCRWKGKRMRLLWSPDWAALTRTLYTEHLTANECCAVCHALKERFRDPTCPPDPLGHFSTLKTQCYDFLDLFASRLDFVYDTSHSRAIILTNLVVHSLGAEECCESIAAPHCRLYSVIKVLSILPPQKHQKLT